MAYEIEYRRTIDAPTIVGAQLLKEDVFRAKGQLIALLPIDLIGVGLTCALFATIYTNIRDEDPSSLPRYRLRNELVFLFFLAGLWHLDMIAWWGMYSRYSSSGIEWRHIAFHAPFVALHGLFGAIALKQAHREWLLVTAFASLVTVVYTVRVYQYVNRLGLTPS